MGGAISRESETAGKGSALQQQQPAKRRLIAASAASSSATSSRSPALLLMSSSSSSSSSAAAQHPAEAPVPRRADRSQRRAGATRQEEEREAPGASTIASEASPAARMTRLPSNSPTPANTNNSMMPAFNFQRLFWAAPQTAMCDGGGTASASSPPPPPPPPPPGSAPPPPPPPAGVGGGGDDDNDRAIAKAAQQQGSALLPPNPGPFEQATYDVRRLVTLDTFDGFRCDINKQVSPFMAAVHSFWLGTSMIPDGRKSTYTFLTQVADDKGLYMARIDPSRWSLDGRVHRAVLGGLAMAKVQVSVTPPSANSSGEAEGAGGGGGSGGSSDQVLAELDFGGLTWTGNVKYGSMGGGVVAGCNYYQAITNRLSAGGEGMYVAANQALLSNYLVKYTIPAATGDEDLFGGGSAGKGTTAASTAADAAPSSSSLAASAGGGSSTFCVGYNAGHGAATLGYRRVVTPNRVQLASELQFSPFTLDSKLLFGAEFRLARSKFSLCVDAADGRVQTLLEAKLGMAPGSPTLNLSADVNHYEDEMRFGYGLTVDG